MLAKAEQNCSKEDETSPLYILGSENRGCGGNAAMDQTSIRPASAHRENSNENNQKCWKIINCHLIHYNYYENVETCVKD